MSGRKTIELEDAQRLFDCLIHVEKKFLDFLSKDQGRFLLDSVQRMYLDPDNAIVDLRKEFGRVVSEVLSYFKPSTWIAFLLWDDFNKRLHVLCNYHAEKETIDGDVYRFASEFIDSPAFKSFGFREPMTDILFSSLSAKKETLVFEWKRETSRDSAAVRPDEAGHQKERSSQPIYVNFNELGGTIPAELDGIKRDIVEAGVRAAKAVPASPGTCEAQYTKLAQAIVAAAERVLDDDGNKRVIDEAIKTIRERLSLSSFASDPANDLCRTLIWNRLFDDRWNCIYYLPAKFLQNSAVSGIVCATEERFTKEEYAMLSQVVNRIFALFHLGFHLHRANLFALRSATTAVMARNKSHIHGSHIEHGLRNRMDTFEEALNERLNLVGDSMYAALRAKLSIELPKPPQGAVSRAV